MMKKERIHIVAGIILNDEKTHVFISRRPSKAHKGGYWEFAGGKVERGENAEQAVIRELNEEVGIIAETISPFLSLDHDYPSKSLHLNFFLVTKYEGEPFGRENQPCQWVELHELSNFEFPEANAPVLAKLQQL